METIDFNEFIYKLDNGIIEEYTLQNPSIYNYKHINKTVTSNKFILNVKENRDMLKNLKLSNLHGRKVSIICDEHHKNLISNSITLLEINNQDSLDLSNETFNIIALQYCELYLLVENVSEEDPYTINYNVQILSDYKKYLCVNKFKFKFLNKDYFIYRGAINLQ